MTDSDTVLVERDGPVTIISINRPERRNAVDGLTARKLYDTFRAFDADDELWIESHCIADAAIGARTVVAVAETQVGQCGSAMRTGR